MNHLNDWLLNSGVPADAAPAISFLLGALFVSLVAVLANWIAKRVIVRLLHALIERSGLNFPRLLREHNVFLRFSHVAPAMVIHHLTPTVFLQWPEVVELAQVGVVVYLIGVALLVIDAALNVVFSAYNSLETGRKMPIKGFIQAIKLIIFLIGLILITSVVLGKSPFILISGLGALTAVLMLVFKDAILGFVAGIQLSANNMVRPGDWIEMPKQGADGDVIDVSLTTVKVQNWDRTITTIPSYLLISDSFKNWRGMTEAGGRRIKRPLYIDMRTVRFLDQTLLDRCLKIQLLRPYLERALAEIQQHNLEQKLEMGDLLNGRHLTNIGTFRAYCVAYLRRHNKVHQDMTQIVRQLEPTPHGLPIEIYVFTNDIGWVAYEGIQSDIFDHLLAIIPHFGLRIFQQPSGSDIADLTQSFVPVDVKPAARRRGQIQK